MKKTNLIKCIFCLEIKESSDEHVMPYTLGGNLTIQEVCAVCNGKLSSLDQSLADASMLTLVRLVEQPSATWGQSARLGDEDEKQLFEVKVGYRLKPGMKAQLIFIRNGLGGYTVRGSSDSPELYETFFSVLRRQIKNKGLRRLKVLSAIESDPELSVSENGFRLVLNRTNEVVFRPSLNSAASTEFDLMTNLLEDKLETIQTAIMQAARQKEPHQIDQPGLMFNLAIDFGRNLRAVSKIAYTFVASQLGAAIVVGSHFDGLRSYILTGYGADEKGSLWWNGDEKEKALGSSRYAVWIKEHSENLFSFAKSGAHTIAIYSLGDRYIVAIEFYAQVSFFIDVGVLGVPLMTPIVHEFDYVNRTNRAVSFEECLEMFNKKLGQKNGE